MPMTLTGLQLKELVRKRRAGETVDLSDAKDGVTISIRKAEFPELVRGTGAEGHVNLLAARNGEIHVQVTAPFKSTVVLSQIEVQPGRIRFMTNLSLILRKTVEMALRARNEQRVVLDGKRMIVRIPPKMQEWIEIHTMSAENDTITLNGKVNKDL